MPNPNRAQYHEEPDLDELKAWLDSDVFGCARVRIKIPKRDDKLYPLPIRNSEGSLDYDYGVVEGVWTFDELRHARRLGAKLLEVFVATTSPSAGPIFESYVKKWYEYRLRFKAEGNEVYSEFCKLFMNSLYGKFGELHHPGVYGRFDQRPAEAGADWVMTTIPDTEMAVWHPEGDEPEWTDHTVFSWAATVTSRARVRLHTLMVVAATIGDVYYCDTDSIHTTALLPSSKKLGFFKLEAEYDKAIFIAKKVYSEHRLDGVWKHKHKGVRVSKDYVPGRVKNTFRRVVKSREALRRHLAAGSSVEVTKLINLDEAYRKAEPVERKI